MKQLDQILAAARAEVRTARRLVRTWTFTIVAIVIGLAGYGQQVVLHALASSLSTTVATMLSPRFLVAQLGTQMLWVLMAAQIFLAFDIRARDQRQRLAEVLDAKPIGTFPLLLGRVLGLVLVGWLPVVLIAIASLALTVVADGLGISPAIEPRSLFIMLFVDVPVQLFIWCAVVLTVALVVRNRLATALICMALLGGYVYAFFTVPAYLIAGFAPVGDMVSLPSDLVPLFLSGPSVMLRLAYVAMAVGLLMLAAALHPRLDAGSLGPRIPVGAALAAIGGLGIGLLLSMLIGQQRQQAAWAAAHDAVANRGIVDVQRVSGAVKIDPGRAVELEIAMDIRAPDASPWVFTFNPGLEVSELELDGRASGFTHEFGLLLVDAPASMSNADVTLSLRASGRPETRFAYLDAAFDSATSAAGTPGAAFLFGLTPAVFDDHYVALMPGIHWLPSPGAVSSQNDTSRGADFFDVDLEVAVPDGWLAAGPGRRQGVDGGSESPSRFAPGAPVNEVGIFAAPFHRFGADIDGLPVELLVSPKHAANFDFFADATDVLVGRLAELLENADRLGLPYPYDGYSVVELPMGVRTYGGGWRMDTALALPGILLLPEGGLPLAKFDWALFDIEELEAREGGVPNAKIDFLLRALQNDVGGANPFDAIPRSFFTTQTGATGVGAEALNAMLNDLADRLLTDRDGFFSAHGINTQVIEAINTATVSIFTGQSDVAMANIRDAATRQPSVWVRALGRSMADLNVHDDPEQAINVLRLKTAAIAKSILDTVGRERTGALLGELRSRYSGRNFTAEDFSQVADELGIDLAAITGDWLFETAMPGFLVSHVRSYRLPDSPTGDPRYQSLVEVRNDEPAPGLLWLSSVADGEAEPRNTGAIRIAANTSLELGLVTPSPPESLQLGYHLALNRTPLRLPVPEADQSATVDEEPFAGARPSNWMPPVNDTIIIDDLDPSFRIDYDEGKGPVIGGGFAIAVGAVPNPDMDEGIPQTSPIVGGSTWTRQVHPGAWGKYRRTLARAGTTQATAQAVFAAELPGTGRWRLEYHIPRDGAAGTRSFSGPGVEVRVNTGGPRVGRQGSYTMSVRTGETTHPIEFDGSVAGPGWNRIGDFDIVDRHVEVVVSNQAQPGNVVVADAVRWSRVDG